MPPTDIQSIITFYEKDSLFDLSGLIGGLSHNHSWWPMAPFLVMAAVLYWVGIKREEAKKS